MKVCREHAHKAGVLYGLSCLNGKAQGQWCDAVLKEADEGKSLAETMVTPANTTRPGERCVASSRAAAKRSRRHGFRATPNSMRSIMVEAASISAGANHVLLLSVR